MHSRVEIRSSCDPAASCKTDRPLCSMFEAGSRPSPDNVTLARCTRVIAESMHRTRRRVQMQVVASIQNQEGGAPTRAGAALPRSSAATPTTASRAGAAARGPIGEREGFPGGGPRAALRGGGPPCHQEQDAAQYTIVLLPWRSRRFSTWRTSALASAAFSRSRPLRLRSATQSLWLTCATSWTMMGPASSSELT